MAKRTLILTGNKQLTRALNALGSNRAREVHRKAVRIAAQPILQQAKSNAPSKTGALRRSLTIRSARKSRKGIGVRVTQKSGHAFKGDQFYGGFQEFGWRLGKRRSRVKNDKQDTRRKIPGKWFMKRAGVGRQDEAIRIYEQELARLIQEASG